MVTVSRQKNCKSLAYYGIGLCFKSSKTPFHFSVRPRTRNAGRGRLVTLGLPINTSGLPSLPVEILEETLSYLSDVPVPLTEFDALHLPRTKPGPPGTLGDLQELAQCAFVPSMAASRSFSKSAQARNSMPGMCTKAGTIVKLAMRYGEPKYPKTLRMT